MVLNASGQVKIIKETKQESKVCNLIASLPEVINANNYVKKTSKGKRHLMTFIESDPTKETPYYWVKVAEDNGSTYYTHFNFYVTPKTYTIKYLDAITGKAIPLTQCSKKLLDEYKIN
jgi:hypothetical protein